MKKFICIFFSILIIFTSSVNSYATGLEIPLIVGSSVLGSEACISLVCSVAVALAGGKVLDDVAKENGFNNGYEYIYNGLVEFSNSSGRAVSDIAKEFTQFMSYTKEGYIVLENYSKSLFTEFLNSFAVTVPSDITVQSYNGKRYSYIPSGSIVSVRGSRLQNAVALYDTICFRLPSYSDDRVVFVGLDKMFIKPITTLTNLFTDDGWGVFTGNPTSYNGIDFYFKPISRYYVLGEDYTNGVNYLGVAFDNLGQFSNAEANALVASLVGVSASSPFDDVITNNLEDSLPVVVNPDVLPNTIGINSINTDDYITLLYNYYNNISVPSVSYVTEYITNEVVNEDTKQDTLPFVPSLDINPDSPPNENIYTYSIGDIFPFCIVFDIANLVEIFKAPRQAPIFTWDLGFDKLGLSESIITIDFNDFEVLANILRYGEDLLFVLGLMFVTRHLLRS